MEFEHISVLLRESVDALNVKPDGVYVDCTAGGGGHSAAVLEKLSEQGRMILIDRDPDAVAFLKERFSGDRRVTVVQERFSNVRAVLDALSVEKIDGALADLGVSSVQLDTADRGFSFHADAPLDMRMSKAGKSARDVVNTYSEKQLCELLYRYGEEKFAPRIAGNIVRARAKKPIETTLELAELVASAVPQKARRDGHPARKTFQAIRIEVNGELTELEEALVPLFDSLKTGGVLAIITFHSLEDRIVKEYFNTLKQGCTCPKDFPVCVCGKKPRAAVRSGGVKASETEISENKRSRSAKLRVAVKL